MKSRLVLLMLILTIGISANAQKRGLTFLKFRQKPAQLFRRVPTLTNVQGPNMSHSFSYWQGSSFTTWSQNGRVRATYYFDVQGVLRESIASISLKKSGILSFWRIQFSPQRSSPLVAYTIH